MIKISFSLSTSIGLMLPYKHQYFKYQLFPDRRVRSRYLNFVPSVPSRCFCQGELEVSRFGFLELRYSSLFD